MALLGGLPDPRDFYKPAGKINDSTVSGLIYHSLRARHVALREIAGVAVANGLSQGRLAIAYNEVTGRKIVAGNVTSFFSGRNPKEKSVETYAKLVGMTTLHQQLVWKPWPALRLPPERSFGRGQFFTHHLKIDYMGSLVTELSPLSDTVKHCEHDLDFGVSLVNRVNLQCERLFATALRDRDRNQEVVGTGVSLEVFETFRVLRKEMEGRVDFERFMATRTRHEDMTERVLVRMFEALFPLSDPGLDDANMPAVEMDRQINNSPRLASQDIRAVLAVTQQLAQARGFNISKMRERLKRDLWYDEWITSLNDVTQKDSE